MRNLVWFIPPEFAVLLMAAGGIAMVLGARALAGGLFMLGMALVLLPPLLEPLFDLLPLWLLIAMLAFVGFGLLRALFEMTIGKASTDHMVGILAADVVRSAVLVPFRIVRWILRRLVH